MATLYVVATPIGNLKDLTSRAIEILSQTSIVAAESILHTRKLLSYLGLKGKFLISCREINRIQATKKILQMLDMGQDVVLVSDSGTPAISDPGSWVIKAVAESNHRLSPLPGPSALTSALSVAGLEANPIVFLGFLPTKTGKRKKLLQKVADTGWATIFFETPYRLAETAHDLLEVFNNRSVILARELSKLYEEILHTSCKELISHVSNNPIKGEITIVVAGSKNFLSK